MHKKTKRPSMRREAFENIQVFTTRNKINGFIKVYHA